MLSQHTCMHARSQVQMIPTLLGRVPYHNVNLEGVWQFPNQLSSDAQADEGCQAAVVDRWGELHPAQDGRAKVNAARF